MNNIVFVVIADVYRKTVLYDNIKRYVINFWTILLAVLLIGFFTATLSLNIILCVCLNNC